MRESLRPRFLFVALAGALLALSLSACGGGGGGGGSSTLAPASGGGTAGGSTVSSSSLTLPESLEVVTNEN